jgi:hypothetical protein
MSSFPTDEALDSKLELANLVFFSIFMLELILKIIGLGMSHFFKDSYNIFDSAVVLGSAIDITLQYSMV